MQEQLCPKYVLGYLIPGEGKGGTPITDVPVHHIFQGKLLEDCTNCGAKKGTVPRIDLRVERLKKVIGSLKCVQAGFAFGVPEDGRELWLELVARTVLEPREEPTAEELVPCDTSFSSSDDGIKYYDLYRYGHMKHKCRLTRTITGSHDGNHVCTCDITWARLAV
jgi:hypothetical protein